MFGCISRQVSYDNALFEIVEKADHASTEIDIKKTKLTINDVNLSIPLESYILDAICYLESSNNWGKDFINRKALIFVDKSLFITTRAINRLSERLEEMKVPGVPWHINDIIEAMLTHGLAEKYLMPTGLERNTWHLLDKEDQKIVTTVKFSEWSAVYRVIPDDDSEAYSIFREQEPQENQLDKPTTGKDNDSYSKNLPAVVANTKSNDVIQQEKPQQPSVQQSKELEQANQQNPQQETKNKASIKPNKQPEHQSTLEKDLGADYQKIIRLFTNIFKSPSVIKKDSDIIIQWNALPDQIKKDKEVVNLLKKHKLIVQNPSGVTHIIDEQACLILNKSERVNEILNTIDANKYLINTNKKLEDVNKPKERNDKDKKTSKPVTPSFLDWMSKNMGVVKVNSNGATVCNMSQVPKKFHSVKLLKEMVGEGLILLGSDEVPKREEIEKIELIFNENLISEIEKKRGEGAHAESTLKNSSNDVPQKPQSHTPNHPQRIPKKTKEAVTHIDVPEDFDPLSSVTNNANQHTNKKDSSRQNMLTDPIIGAIYASNVQLTPLLDSYIQGEIGTVELIQGCDSIGLPKEDLRIIRKAIDNYAR